MDPILYIIIFLAIVGYLFFKKFFFTGAWLLIVVSDFVYNLSWGSAESRFFGAIGLLFILPYVILSVLIGVAFDTALYFIIKKFPEQVKMATIILWALFLTLVFVLYLSFL